MSVQASLLMRALSHEPIPRTPIWLMRQAGRYLPEYRAVRAKAGDFMSLCQAPKLACEVTLQPLQRFDLDAAIVFSDILTIPDAMGLGLYFVEGEGPCFRSPLQTPDALKAIPADQLLSRLDYVMETVSLVRSSMPEDLPLIGFSGSPWTLACYMMEGRSSRSFNRLRQSMVEDPAATQRLLSTLTDAVIAYLEGQFKAGANVLMVFDTWGGLLSPEDYRAFSLGWMQKIVDYFKAHHPTVPLILFTKGGSSVVCDLASTGTAAIGLDWTVDLHWARQQVGSRVALQGNLDPAVLLSTPATIEAEVARLLAAYGHGSGHIFNLGHGITPDVPPEHVAVLVDAVHRLSVDYHG